jgi:hypothetical protein
VLQWKFITALSAVSTRDVAWTDCLFCS